VASVKDQAIVLKTWEFSETSQTVSLFTRDHGALRGIAKGAFRPAGKFGGGFEVLTRGQVVVNLKPSVELATLIEWDLQEVYWAARKRLPSFYAATYMVDLVRSAVQPLDPHVALFDRLVELLRELDRNPGSEPAVLARFQWDLLVEMGFRPVLEHHARSGESIGANRLYGFDPGAGGLVGDPGPGSSHVWRVRAETIAVLRGLAAGAATMSEGDPDALWRAAKLLGEYLSHVLGKELPSREPAFDDVGKRD